MDQNTLKFLEGLAQKLGTTAEHLWDVLIRAAFVSGITSVFEGVFLTVVSFFLLRFTKKAADEGEEIAVLTGIGFIVTAVFAFFCFDYSIKGLFAPEYWALEKVLEVVKK